MYFISTLKHQAFQILTVLFGDQDKMLTLPVLSGPGKGLQMRLDLIRRKEVYFWGTYERYILSQVMSYVHRGQTVWDCGTYIGYYALVFARIVGPAGRVVAIELDARNLNRTKQNVALNRLENVDFVNVGIGAPCGEVEFIMGDGMAHSHFPGTYAGLRELQSVQIMEDEGRYRASVECVSLDQLLLEKGLPKPNFIKIDIEGAEKDALKHAPHIFGQVRPLLLLELHNPECDHAAWEFSQRFDYELKCINTGKIFTKADEVRGTLLCRPIEFVMTAH